MQRWFLISLSLQRFVIGLWHYKPIPAFCCSARCGRLKGKEGEGKGNYNWRTWTAIRFIHKINRQPERMLNEGNWLRVKNNRRERSNFFIIFILFYFFFLRQISNLSFPSLISLRFFQPSFSLRKKERERKKRLPSKTLNNDEVWWFVYPILRIQILVRVITLNITSSNEQCSYFGSRW